VAENIDEIQWGTVYFICFHPFHILVFLLGFHTFVSSFSLLKQLTSGYLFASGDTALNIELPAA
jgi:hypothetical protein